MRPLPAVLSGRILPLVPLLLLLAAGVLGCDPGPTGSRISRVEINAPSEALRPGDLMQVSASALDASGNIVTDVAVRWRSLTPATLSVREDGLMLALGPGEGRARATVEGVSASLTLALVNPPIASIRLNVDTLVLAVPGGTETIVADARDASNIGLIKPALTWESSASRLVSVAASGQVFAEAVGEARITVRGDGKEASAVVRVVPAPIATAPVIGSVSAPTLVPGQSVVVQGSGFGSTPSANTVLLDGVPLTVTAASPTQLSLALPAAAQFACEPTRTVALQVGTSGGIGATTVRLQVGAQRTLAVGQSVALTTAAEARCQEFVGAPGRYLLTVPNAARATGAAAIGVRLAGMASGAAGAPTVLASPGAAAHSWSPALPGTSIATRRARARFAAHQARLEASVAIAAAAPGVGRPAARRASLVASAVAPPVGSIVPVRIPMFGPSCGTFTAIGARSVYAGAHVVILEDTIRTIDGRATLAGQMDDAYAALGAELDGRGWAIATQFGDPLALDAALDDNDRVLVVFSPRVNQRAGGAILAGAVPCDFFSRAIFEQSNVGEYLYAQVPTALVGGFDPGSVARWRQEMRATLVHELKHLVSFAERLSRGWPLEQPWLEEATARHAEELFARDVFAVARSSNAGFAATLACELSPTLPACVDAPRAMAPHFDGLWDFLAAPTARTPLGPVQEGDFSFYGSGWALTRWVLDDLGLAEATTYRALTASAQAGVANLEARSGRNWDELLTQWSLAMVTDDRPGFAPLSPRLRFAAWDLRSIFQGLCDVAGECITPPETPSRYARPWPVVAQSVTGGQFTLDIAAIVPGGFAVVDLVVPSGVGNQVIELRGPGSTALPASARLAIVRVE